MLKLMSTLVKKADYDTKMDGTEKKLDDHHGNKYITTQKINRVRVENFEARLKQANLTAKAAIAHYVKKTDFND